MTMWGKRIKKLAPGQLLILVYAVAIFIGALALSLPAAATGKPLSFLDALFTATSAQCVTGLIVVDTGTKLTLFGQMIVLLLIQLGGLGITTFSVYLFFYLRIGVGVRGRWMVQETLLHKPVESLKDLVREILMLTLIVEGVGAALMAVVFIPAMGFWKGLYCSLFHSVSAFCNAGFSLFPDSLVGYHAHPLINVTVMGLIILGGIGFLVIRETLDFLPGRRSKGRKRLSLHSRLVLLTSGVLIAGGALLIGLLEYQGAMAGMEFGEGFLTAVFQSVTARTAGFNTIDLIQFTPPTLFILIFLMFIGASPGSAGGGIKTTSLALFVAILHSRLKGNSHTNIFHRTVPNEVVTKTLSLVMLAILLIGAAIFGLMAVQHPGPATPDNLAAFMVYTFEAVSAFATVGLSIGGTGQLFPLGKVIIILLMFIGRVGLLTVAFSIARRSRGEGVLYSQENIMVG
ncbi:MAG: potassium transporter [Deltaproteobacteria bacterium]|nr:potassium transporter [Deltaproteobacteria bacterium]